MKKDKEAEQAECLCKTKVPIKDILSHAKVCNHLKAMFGSLPDVIDSSIKSAKDASSAKVLYYIFKQARSICRTKMKIKEPVPQPIPVPIQAPEVKYPFPIMEPKPVTEVKKLVNNEEEKKRRVEDDCSKLVDQSSVYCNRL